MVQQVRIHPQWACGRRCHGPAGQMSLSGTGRESLFPPSGQLHGWMSPREERVWRKGVRQQVRRRRNGKMEFEGRSGGRRQDSGQTKCVNVNVNRERKDKEAEGWRKIEIQEGRR